MICQLISLLIVTFSSGVTFGAVLAWLILGLWQRRADTLSVQVHCGAVALAFASSLRALLLAELATLTHWSVQAAVWQHLSVALGTVPSVRVLALTPSDVIRSACRSVRITLVDTNNQWSGEPEPSSVEVIQLARMWRIVRRLFNMDDIDLLQPPAPPPPVSVGGTATSSGDRKKIKVSHHADQLDDTEVEAMTATELEEPHVACRMAAGPDPRPEADPSQEQLAVMLRSSNERKSIC